MLRQYAKRYAQPYGSIRTSNSVQETNSGARSAKPFGYRFCKIKREATQTHKNQPFVASHFILPKRANTAPMKLKIFNIASLKKPFYELHHL